MVFKTVNDHTSFHGGGIPIQLDDGSYICKRKTICVNGNRMNECPSCKQLKHCSSSKCISCYNKERGSNIPSKTILNELIYNNSFVQIGKMFGVSDNTIRKWCKKYELPFKAQELTRLKK